MREYPQGIDTYWIAADRLDQLGVFYTAGCAPIPVHALTRQFDPDKDFDAIMKQMIDMSGVTKTADYQDDFVEAARKGFFIYDWSDIHRVNNLLNGYELIAIPTRPLQFGDLPPLLKAALGDILVINAAFGSERVINVESELRCLRGEA